MVNVAIAEMASEVSQGQWRCVNIIWIIYELPALFHSISVPVLYRFQGMAR